MTTAARRRRASLTQTTRLERTETHQWRVGCRIAQGLTQTTRLERTETGGGVAGRGIAARSHPNDST